MFYIHLLMNKGIIEELKNQIDLLNKELQQAAIQKN
jgi:hypothetical protein